MAEMGVVESAVSCDFFTDEIGLFEGFLSTSEFYFSHDKTLIIAVELIDFEDMTVVGADKVTGLLDGARFADCQEVASIIEGDFHLELIAREPPVCAGTFDGQVTAVIANANAHRATVSAGNVSLRDAGRIEGDCLKGVALDEELAFNFLCHSATIDANCLSTQDSPKHKCDNKENRNGSDNPIDNAFGLAFFACSLLGSTEIFLCFTHSSY